MWRSLNHERVLPLLGIFEDVSASRAFLVSPYTKNGTLSQARQKIGPLISEIQRLVRVSLDCTYSKLNFIDFRSSRRLAITFAY